MWLSVDPLAEEYPGWSPYNYTLLNPVNFIDPDGRSVDTKYKNNKTGEIVEVHDGKDVTVEVGQKDFAYAKVYASQLNSELGGKSIPAIYLDKSYDNIIDRYETFYYETRYGSRWERYQNADYWIDKGPSFRRSLTIGGAGGVELILGGASKSVSYGSKVLNKLISTEKGAQSLGGIQKYEKALSTGDLFTFYKDPIYTYVYKGKTYILDGHHRIQAAINKNVGLEAMELSTKKAMELFKTKIIEIQKGLH